LSSFKPKADSVKKTEETNLKEIVRKTSMPLQHKLSNHKKKSKHQDSHRTQIARDPEPETVQNAIKKKKTKISSPDPEKE
jgi:hypothetical protein